MPSVLSLVLLFTSFNSIAFAVNLQPAVGAKMCVGRKYTKDHMTSHPEQKFSRFAVIVEHFPKTQENDFTYVSAKVVGEHAGKLWGNEAVCDYQTDGSLKCQIDCDGGAFTLSPNADSADFKVKKDYYFPLFKQGAEPGFPKEEDVLSLDYDDLANRTYRLFEADTQTCVNIWKAYESADHGC